MSYIQNLFLNDPAGSRRDVEILEQLVLTILQERQLTELPNSPRKRIEILNEAKRRYTKERR